MAWDIVASKLLQPMAVELLPAKPFEIVLPTIRDLQMSADSNNPVTPVQFEMMQPMADPCPECGAFNMLVGDYVCWGSCPVCAAVEPPL